MKVAAIFFFWIMFSGFIGMTICMIMDNANLTFFRHSDKLAGVGLIGLTVLMLIFVTKIFMP